MHPGGPNLVPLGGNAAETSRRLVPLSLCQIFLTEDQPTTCLTAITLPRAQQSWCELVRARPCLTWAPSNLVACYLSLTDSTIVIYA